MNLDVPRRQIRRYSDLQDEDINRSNISNEENRGEQYDFLLSSSKSSSLCSDLFSQEFSDEIDKGLMLWAGEPTLIGEDYEEAEGDNDEDKSNESTRIVESTLNSMARIDEAEISKASDVEREDHDNGINQW